MLAALLGPRSAADEKDMRRIRWSKCQARVSFHPRACGYAAAVRFASIRIPRSSGPGCYAPGLGDLQATKVMYSFPAMSVTMTSSLGFGGTRPLRVKAPPHAFVSTLLATETVAT